MLIFGGIMIRRFLYSILTAVAAVSCTGNKLYEAPAVSCDISFSERLLSKVQFPVADTAFYVKKVNILYSGNNVTVDTVYEGMEVEADGSSLLIRSRIPAVRYCVGGNSPDGSLTIVSEFSPLVTLCGLRLNATGRDVLQLSSREVVVLQATGESVLSDLKGEAKDDKLAATVKIMGRSMFIGPGSINVSGGRKSAILCTDDIYLCGAGINVVSAAGNALKLGKSAYVSSGSMKLSSVKDVVKSKDGSFVISGGTVDISSASRKADAVQAGSFCMTGGNMDISVSGEAADGVKAAWICLSGGNASITTNGDAMFNEKKLDYSSASCLKADSCIYIASGNYVFASNGNGAKGVSCDGNIVVSGGNIKAVTRGAEALHPIDLNAHASCKGIKSDGSFIMNGGNVEVLVLGKGERNEGVESKKDMAINGGNLYIYAYDDAVNCGERMVVNGGMLYAYSVANDAIDSNVSIDINGGTVIADGSFSPEQGIDVDDFSKFSIRGGLVISIGGGMGPVPSLPLNGNSSAGTAVWSGVSLKRGSFLNIEDSKGNALISYSLTRDMPKGTVLVSAPFIKPGEKLSFSLSDSISSGETAGNGLVYNGEVHERISGALFVHENGISILGMEGGVKHIAPGKGMEGFGFPPPPHPGPAPDGKGMLPPPGRMPPPPAARDIKDFYSEDNLPNNTI